jgi:hypothetical protein
MPRTVQLSISQEGCETSHSVGATIPDDEWALLQSFHQYSGELLSTKFVEDGMPSSLKVKGTSNGPVTFEVTLPDWDDVVLFLYYLRPLYLQSEHANFHATCNVIARRFENPHVRAMIDLQKRIFSGSLLRTAIRISVDDIVVNSEEVLSAWLNSYEYHRDVDKRRFLDTLNKMLPLDASQVLFIQLLTEKVKAIAAVASLAAVVLGIQQTVMAPTALAHDGSSPPDECA